MASVYVRNLSRQDFLLPSGVASVMRSRARWMARASLTVMVVAALVAGARPVQAQTIGNQAVSGAGNTLTLTDEAIATTSGIGGRATSGATLTMDGGSITIDATPASATAARGLEAVYSGATINATNVDITTTGTPTNPAFLGPAGASANTEGIVNLTGGTIETNSNRSFGVLSVGFGATLTATGTTIITHGDYSDGAEYLGRNVTANGTGVMTLNNVNITTYGTQAYGAAQATSLTALTPTPTIVTTTPSTLIMNGGSLTTHGTNATGLFGNSSTLSYLTDVSILTDGYQAPGVQAQGDGRVILTNVGITTEGTLSYGIQGVASSSGTSAWISGDNVTVLTTGQAAHGLLDWARAQIDLDNSTVTTQGLYAAALLYTNYRALGTDPSAPGTVNITNSVLRSEQYYGVVVTGVNATLRPSTLNLTLTNSTVDSPTGAWLYAQTAGLNTAVANIVADHSQVTGFAITDPGSVSNVALGNGSTWTMTGPSNLTNLTLDAGTLRYGAATTLAVASPILLASGGGTVDTNSFNPTLTAQITGAGAFAKIGAGTLTEASDSSLFAGATDVQAGAFRADGLWGSAASTMTVQAGATVGGSGTIGGSVDIANGATLSPHAGGTADTSTLTIDGALTLHPDSILAYNFGEADVVGGTFNDLTVVHGMVTLGGAIDVTETPGRTIDPGVYRVISYDTTTTPFANLNRTSPLRLGSTPISGFSVQTSVDGEVNLVVGLAPDVYTVWDGDLGPHGDGVVNGGNGVWQNSTGNTNWTDNTALPTGAWADAGFAIFEAAPGTVRVDNSLGNVVASGMQFASNGYVVTGDDLTLVDSVDTPGQSIIRVGDGTSLGAGMTATIASRLIGTPGVGLEKADLGTLVLTGLGSTIDAVAITGGQLTLAQNGLFQTVGGGFAVGNGTRLSMTAPATLDVKTTFSVADTGTLAVDLPSTIGGPKITARDATLGANSALIVTGFNPSSVGKASQLSPAMYTVIHTTNGITGDFGSVSIAEALPDYLRLVAGKDGSGLNYDLGLGLSWYAPIPASHGTFTLNSSSAFDVDVPLVNVAANPSLGWDGRTLTKAGTGTLTLSAPNSYAGYTGILGGTVALSGAGDIAASAGVTLAAANTTFSIAAANGDRTIQDLSGVAGSRVDLGARTLTEGTANTTQFDGVMSGTGGFTKQGAGFFV
ncbi:MAG: autotransporter-associated beta strand repeat-containing protein, partial [Acidobacteriaceae bacterium]|nr:autotransporter-associated beta strand repeat-containing protein [Acidobacteriaceae bacterium]